MFVCTLRKGGLRKLAVVAVCGVVLAGAAITVGVVRNKGDAVDAAAQGGALSQQITGAQDVATFLQGYGVEVDPTTAEVSTVTVPRKWDDNFKAFNEVIKESGLDLSRVKNKKVDKWVVLIPAQSTETQKSYGVVLVYKNEARGAYIGIAGGKDCAMLFVRGQQVRMLRGNIVDELCEEIERLVLE